MRAIISGQAGVGVLIDGDAGIVVRIGGLPEVPCRPTDILWLFADASDIAEFDAISKDQLLMELTRAWRVDRALQHFLILLDRDEKLDTRRTAAALLRRVFTQTRILNFVADRLYSVPLTETADIKGAELQVGGRAGDGELADFLAELEHDQDAIRVSREEWDALPLRLFHGLENRQQTVATDLELAGREKRALERVMIDAGAFRFFVHAVRKGSPPSGDSTFLRCLNDARLSAFRGRLAAVVAGWTEAVAPRQRAMVAIQVLPAATYCRLKAFAEGLVASVGEAAKGRNYQDLLGEAAATITAESRPRQKESADLQLGLINGMRDVAARWQREWQPRQHIWDAVKALSPQNLIELQQFARYRLRAVGRKALGRDYQDLVDEAITATASGKRVWKEGVDLQVHLLGAIRSISSSWREKAGNEYLESELTQPGAESPLEQVSTNLNPERIYEAKEKLEHLMGLFTTDEVASEMIKLFGLGYTAKEIQSRLEISLREFDTITKRIRRKLDSEFGEIST